MTLPPPQPQRASRSILSGAVGFSVAGVVSFFLARLFFLSPVSELLLSRMPTSQPLAKLTVGILLVVAGLAVWGGLLGAMGGWVLSRVDRTARVRRLIASGAIAFGLTQAILILLLVLLTSFIALYNNFADSHRRGYLFLFGFYGLVYGGVSGLLLGLISVGWRQFWRVWLTAMGAGLLGGLFLGLVIWRWSLANDAGNPPSAALMGLLLAAGFYALLGGALGAVYHWLAAKRKATGKVQASMGRLAKMVLATVVVLTVVFFIRTGRTLVAFTTIQPGSLSSVLHTPTEGVAWEPVQTLATGPVAKDSEPAIAVDATGKTAVAWAQETAGAGDIFLAVGIPNTEGVVETWDAAINVSASITNSMSPQLAVDSSGGWNIVWTETTTADVADVFYSRCLEDACTQPIRLSDFTGVTCAETVTNADRAQALAAIAVDTADTVMVVWQTGDGRGYYSTWPTSRRPPANPTGCVLLAFGADSSATSAPSLVDGSPGIFSLAFDRVGDQGIASVLRSRYANGAWQDLPTLINQGQYPDMLVDADGGVHTAWCNAEGSVSYEAADGQVERVTSPPCLGRPALSQDGEGKIHMVWYADQVENVNGTVNPGLFLYESIRNADKWTSPAIITQPLVPTQPAAAHSPAGVSHLAWVDADAAGEMTVNYAAQPNYKCTEGPRTSIGQVMLAAMITGKFRPTGDPIPYCGNRFDRIAFTPNPPPNEQQPPTPDGAYDTISELVASARYEALFATMEYQEDVKRDSPGFDLATAVVDLYNRLKANPALYPRGITVRILLGNYPNVSQFEWGDQIWHVIDDLKDAGLPALTDPELGWKLEVANFDGQLPHSHTKFVVIDGKTTVAKGFNYSYLHLPKDHPSGLGLDMADLGLQVTGPVAQASLSAYDDLWEGANQLRCEDFHPPLGVWQLGCDWQTATATHAPEVLRYTLPDSDSVAFSLFRNTNYHEADVAIASSIAAAQETIDIFEVNFSLELQCALNVIEPGLCTFENALPWMQALMSAIADNGVQVRVLVEGSAMNGLENTIAMSVFRQELMKRGLEDHVEFRYYNGKMHAKSMVIDSQLLIIGSQNLHYSAWGDRGLAEYSIATEDPTAIETWQKMFEYYWEQGRPVSWPE